MNGHKYEGTRPYKQPSIYKLVVPSRGTITVSGYYTSKDNGWPTIGIYTTANCDYNSRLFGVGLEAGETQVESNSASLDAGTYYLSCYDGSVSNSFSFSYVFWVDYDFDTTLEPKLTSPKAGQFKITATKGDKVSGYEIRYKVKGAKKWTTETLATKKTLNHVISGLTSGKKYTVQVRKYVTDTYGDTYFSNWSAAKNVKIK
ncbi:MAG: fibronectin type III domain-containing protein [Lachnospiraceae bacterium]|nr:fibronectin type III domain-containing protein [Lachnospiraceae bacterium]